jgi:hypothetical protein
MGEIREPEVRRWHKEHVMAGPKASPAFGPVTVAKAYRLLHAIMTTAADDGLIRRNPCGSRALVRKIHPNARSCP